MGFVFNDMKAELVRLAHRDTRLDAATRQPNREGLRMMIAAQFAPGVGIAFDHGRAAEFTAPKHESVLEQSPLLQISNQSRAGTVSGGSLVLHSLIHFAVMIPAFMEELHEANVAFDKAPRQKAIHRERGFARLRAVHFERLR